MTLLTKFRQAFVPVGMPIYATHGKTRQESYRLTMDGVRLRNVSAGSSLSVNPRRPSNVHIPRRTSAAHAGDAGG